jgi:polysaccharide pyruvyl transferase WcaK-like protein
MLAGLLEAVGPEMRRQCAVVVKDGRRVEWLRKRLGVEPVQAGVQAVLRALRRADALVLCGGTHFHDDYQTRRYLRHLRYMFRYVSLSMLSKLMGKRVTWLGMGFGPFYRRPTRWITRLGLSLCDRVSVRDQRSLEEIAGWVAPERLDLAFDLAALLMGNPRGRWVRPRKEPFRCMTLGLSVTSVRQSRSVGRRTDEVIWRRLAWAVNRTLDENPLLRVRVMVLRGGNREDDESVSGQMHRAITSIHPGRSELIPYHPEPTVTWQRIAECDAFVATRYHAGVLAYLAECRLLLLEYHRKVRDLAAEIGLAEKACLRISEQVDEELLVTRIRALTRGDEAFRARLPVPSAAQRALRNLAAFQGSFHA